MKTRLLVIALSLSFLALIGTILPLPERANIGVQWTNGGTQLNVLYREDGQFFVREWDFTNDGEELEVFPFEGEFSDFSTEAYATGAYAVLTPENTEDVEVYIDRASGNFNRRVYGLVAG